MNSDHRADYLYWDSVAANRMTEARTLESEGQFAIRHFLRGAQVLDIGCGRGSITVGIARLVAPGRVVGIDTDPSALEAASNLAMRGGVDNVEFKEANLVEGLPFADNAFDAVWAHAVLYHLPKPQLCLSEVWRVMKAGGFVAVRDSYCAGDIIYPRVSEVLDAFELTRRLLRARGADPDLGPRHRELLAACGFADICVSARYENFSENGGELERYVRESHVPFLREPKTRKDIIERGAATVAELDAMELGLLAWGASQSGVFLRCRCEAIGWKPRG